MLQRIIYPQDGGPIAVVTPARVVPRGDETPPEALLRLARQVVPAGRPFRIALASELPADRTWRDAWTADFSSPDGHGGEA
ncbi:MULTISPECIES: hypothetical protein [Roseomonadaceae]|uniref:Uncharacterized protein n=1 Tax=Falsiroseomonas oleicola TaxID=2801474 RepID=A0ABS6H7S3_9PROT|nr:hypothetical protein [Roseomonas oleicola]MBU8544003.1 hypothetical protein [Roseomonas oleicola]